jgi:hypothetical protein
MSDLVSPFHAGSQYADWTARNCWGCALYDPDTFNGACEIDGALGIAYLEHGKVPRGIAERMGYFKNEGAYTWDCPEWIDTGAG